MPAVTLSLPWALSPQSGPLVVAALIPPKASLFHARRNNEENNNKSHPCPNLPSLPRKLKTSLHPKAEQVLARHHPQLMRELFDLLRELFKENPPVIAGERGHGERGGGGGAVRKREWVAQRVSELSEVVGCMVIAGYYHYRVSLKYAHALVCCGYVVLSCVLYLVVLRFFPFFFAAVARVERQGIHTPCFTDLFMSFFPKATHFFFLFSKTHKLTYSLESRCPSCTTDSFFFFFSVVPRLELSVEKSHSFALARFLAHPPCRLHTQWKKRRR